SSAKAAATSSSVGLLLPATEGAQAKYHFSNAARAGGSFAALPALSMARIATTTRAAPIKTKTMLITSEAGRVVATPKSAVDVASHAAAFWAPEHLSEIASRTPRRIRLRSAPTCVKAERSIGTSEEPACRFKYATLAPAKPDEIAVAAVISP